MRKTLLDLIEKTIIHQYDLPNSIKGVTKLYFLLMMTNVLKQPITMIFLK